MKQPIVTTALISTMIGMGMVMETAQASDLGIQEFEASLDFAQVTHASATQQKDGSWCISATVRHNDQGWEHYADGWEVIDLDGKSIGFRLLSHPHDDEQPFTRRKCGLKIPADTKQVAIRAKCNVHGYGGKAFLIDINAK